jgi:Mg2+-importing ATPase
MTELFILFIIRTPKPFLRSRPSNSLVWLSILSFARTTALIYIPGAEKLGLHALPIHVFIAIVAIIILYVFTAELLKLFFFKRIRNAHN